MKPHDEPGLPPLPKQAGTGPLGKGTIAGGAAALNVLVPGIAIPVAGVVAALQALGDRLNKQHEERLFELLESAAEVAALTPESVVRKIIARQDLVLLTAEAVDSARRTRVQGKARLLGRSLGAILTDDARIDPESIWLRIMGVVEPVHLRLLHLILGPNNGTSPGKWAPSFPLTVEDIGYRLGLREAVLPVVQDLLRAGLVIHPSGNGLSFGSPDAFGQSIQATQLGAELFDRLSMAEPADAN